MAVRTAFDFVPPLHELASPEVQRLSFNFAAYLDSGEAVVSATSILTNMRTEALYPAGLSGAPTVASPVVFQTLTGLAGGERYELLVVAVIAGGSKEMAGRLILQVPTRSAA